MEIILKISLRYQLILLSTKYIGYMLIIKFAWNRELDVVKDDTGLYAINSEGLIAMKPSERILPSQEAFEGGVKMLGLATKAEKKLKYTFDQITPELLASGIPGLSSSPIFQPQYIIIVEDLGRKTVWNRDIEQIYFSNY